MLNQASNVQTPASYTPQEIAQTLQQYRLRAVDEFAVMATPQECEHHELQLCCYLYDLGQAFQLPRSLLWQAIGAKSAEMLGL